MGAYQTVVNAVRSSITPLITSPATGTFVHGRILDASFRSIDKKFSLVVLYPFIITPPERINHHSSDLLMGFFKQDRADSNEEEREQIINDMDNLSDLFLNNLSLYDKRFEYQGLIKEPQYLQYAGTVSGVALRFKYLTLEPC